MEENVPLPRINKLPFIVFDVLLVLTALIVGFSYGGPLPPMMFFLVIFCVGMGGVVACMPFYVEFRSLAKLKEYDLSQANHENARRIEAAMLGIQEVGENVTQYTDRESEIAAKFETLLERMESRIVEIKKQPAPAGIDPEQLHEALSEQLAAVRDDFAGAIAEQAAMAGDKQHDKLNAALSKLQGLPMQVTLLSELANRYQSMTASISDTAASLIAATPAPSVEREAPEETMPAAGEPWPSEPGADAEMPEPEVEADAEMPEPEVEAEAEMPEPEVEAEAEMPEPQIPEAEEPSPPLDELTEQEAVVEALEEGLEEAVEDSVEAAEVDEELDVSDADLEEVEEAGLEGVDLEGEDAADLDEAELEDADLDEADDLIPLAEDSGEAPAVAELVENAGGEIIGEDLEESAEDVASWTEEIEDEELLGGVEQDSEEAECPEEIEPIEHEEALPPVSPEPEPVEEGLAELDDEEDFDIAMSGAVEETGEPEPAAQEAAEGDDAEDDDAEAAGMGFDDWDDFGEIAPSDAEEGEEEGAPPAQPDLMADMPPAEPKSKPAKAKGATTLIAQVLIGIGNKPYVRGSGPGLSEEEGVPMEFLEIGKWQWVAPDSGEPVTVRIYKNDEIPAEGDPVEIPAGQRRSVAPKFPQ